MNFIRRIILEYRLKRAMRANFAPERGSLARAKQVFLNEVEKRAAAPVPGLSRFLLPLKMAGATLAIGLVLGGSGVVYADRSRVGADHPLYPLKRFAENVKLQFSPTEESKQKVREDIASRRLEEMDQLKTKPGREQEVEKLDQEFKKEVKDILKRQSGKPDKSGRAIEIEAPCKAAKNLMRKRAKISSDTEDLPELSQRCGANGEVDLKLEDDDFED